MKANTATALVTVLVLLGSCQPRAADPNAAPAGAGQTQGQRPTGQPGAGPGAPAGASGTAAAPGAAGAQGGYGGQGGFGGGQRSSRSLVVPVQTSVVTFGPLVANNTSAGAVSPETQSSVAAGANGTVKTIVRKAGEWVKAGDVVVQLDDAQLRLSLQLAQTALQNAIVNSGFDETGKPSPSSTIALKIQYAQSDVAAKQKTLAADQELFKIGGVTQTTLDNDQSAIQNSQATLESLRASIQQSTLAVQTATLQVQQAQLNLSNAGIKAPYDGQISVVNVHPGEYVGTSTATFVLVSRQKIITFSVPPSDAPGLSNRTPVKFTYSGVDYGATITQVPAAPVAGLIPLTASLPLNLSPPLGTVGTITYTVELARGTLVPLQAVQSAENTTFVFTVGQNNKVGKSIVRVLAETGAFAAVTGVNTGASVILSPPPGLLVGASVQPQAATGVQAVPAAAQTPGAPGTGARRQGAPGAPTQGQAPGTAGQAGSAASQAGGWNGPKEQGAPGAAGGTPAADGTAPAAGNRGNFDPSKLTPEQRAQFQARRKAAADAAAKGAPADGTAAPAPSGGQ